MQEVLFAKFSTFGGKGYFDVDGTHTLQVYQSSILVSYWNS